MRSHETTDHTIVPCGSKYFFQLFLNNQHYALPIGSHVCPNNKI